MKNLTKNLKKHSLYVGVFALSLGVSSCSDDDDGGVNIPDPDDATGSFTVEDQTLSQNTLVLQDVSAGQQSWIVVRNSENVEVADPISVDETTTGDISIVLNQAAGLAGTEEGDNLTISFYEDDDDEGIQGEYDSEDDLIEDASDVDIVRTVNVTGPTLVAADEQIITDSNEVTFTSVRTAGDSWIVLYDDAGDIIGRGQVNATTTENVAVPFNEGYEYTDGDTITPRLHIDEDPVGEFNYGVDGVDDLDVQDTYGYGTDGTATPYEGTGFTAVNPAPAG